MFFRFLYFLLQKQRQLEGDSNHHSDAGVPSPTGQSMPLTAALLVLSHARNCGVNGSTSDASRVCVYVLLLFAPVNIGNVREDKVNARSCTVAVHQNSGDADNWNLSNPIMLPCSKTRERERTRRVLPPPRASLFVSLDYPVPQQHTRH